MSIFPIFDVWGPTFRDSPNKDIVALGLSRSEAEKGVAAARDEIGADADHQSLIQAVLAK